ncbi:hypothetical protein CLLI_06040 [Clostridium liquoris]|uniref:Uncharacterized protein n=1 Tax=Clostridium liquoris TaxID=1289519 RepID=A0A2T0B7K6_9CLOT|nr:hypothetical protein [Clostridium liquoris]PRR79871.1 hypothetical protein CLLI_06040 [Clostridium liquoris]
MPKTKTVANNGLSIIENYNNLFTQINAAKTADDVSVLLADVRTFIAIYKKVDNTMANRVYEKFQSKLQSLLEENNFVYERMNNKVNETRDWAYDYAGEKDDSQAVQSKVLQLIAKLPKSKTTANENGITTTISNTINSGVIGSKAVLELLKYPAYADMVSARFREKAFEGSKTPAQQAFERLKETSLREAEQALSSVYLQGFHLRNIEKQANAFKKPTNWNETEGNQ